jgi:hypothetical protein
MVVVLDASDLLVIIYPLLILAHAYLLYPRLINPPYHQEEGTEVEEVGMEEMYLGQFCRHQDNVILYLHHLHQLDYMMVSRMQMLALTHMSTSQWYQVGSSPLKGRIIDVKAVRLQHVFIVMWHCADVREVKWFKLHVLLALRRRACVVPQ